MEYVNVVITVHRLISRIFKVYHFIVTVQEAVKNKINESIEK